MDLKRFRFAALFTSSLCCTMVSRTAQAVSFLEFVDPHSAPGNQFGHTVVALSTGNVVITSPFDDFGGSNAGAVYLFNGATGALISTLRGSSVGDSLGSGGVTALANGNYVVASPGWSNVGAVDAGAVTWGSGASGVTGTVSAVNSLVGSTALDRVGLNGVTVLSNGNYVVVSSNWDNGAMNNAGAVSWGSSTTGVSGTVSAANSLVGSAASDFVGSSGVTTLSNGNYVVVSPNWDNGGIANAGAVTWGNGATGVSGGVSSANSLVGSTSGDLVGNPGVTALTNGNYVVRSSSWDNGAVNGAGAATWGSGSTGVSGAVSAANSLVGSTANDNVGSGGVTALSNGNYVVVSPDWDNGAIAGVGAVTWRSGTTVAVGAVSAANSLVGSTAGDRVGFGGVTALTNGGYVVASPFWANGAVSSAGAATWGSSANGVSGAVSAANSLVGSTSSDQVGSSGVTALTNGNYVVGSLNWDNGAIANAGAATWGIGTTGVSGTVSAANSLVGSTANNSVGAGVTALSNGNYVVVSPSWDNGANADVGAVTWGSGGTGRIGVVSIANSLIGSSTADAVGEDGVTALANGNYVVTSHLWDNGTAVDAGAVTWGRGTSGVSGTISSANSLVGFTAGDQVGLVAIGGVPGVTALSNGNYVVTSWQWDHGGFQGAGAVTWGSGTTGVIGTVTEANSLAGSRENDFIGRLGVTALSNGGFVTVSSTWNNGDIQNAGAASWGSGIAVLNGPVTAANSLVGAAMGTNVHAVIVEDTVNGTFFARFLLEGGGRVRVRGTDPSPVIVSATDVPNDQGGWVRLTFARSILDDVTLSPPIATYGIWRRVPNTAIAEAGRGPSAANPPRHDVLGVERLRSGFPPSFEVWEADGSVFVTVPDMAADFPPGTWALLTSVPAAQQLQYVVDVPTISDVEPNDFVVTAHTTIPSIWYVSNVVSGQSSSSVDVGDDRPVAFALEGVRPNPTSGVGLHVTFVLPSGAAARLELLDVSGRQVLAREVGTLGAGRHTVNLAAGRSLAAGIYWLRLVQGVNRRTTRVAVVD